MELFLLVAHPDRGVENSATLGEPAVLAPTETVTDSCAGVTNAALSLGDTALPKMEDCTIVVAAYSNTRLGVLPAVPQHVSEA